MYRCFKWMALMAALVMACASLVGAATKAKPKPKPAAKTQPKSPPHIVQGTTQLAGEYAEFGKTYTLGKDSPMNVTLNSAEYTVDNVKVGDTEEIPNADQKALVLHYTLHNPQKSEVYVYWDFFGYTAVDSNNANWEFTQRVGVESTKASLDVSLKPAQKIDVFTTIMVPAKGEIPKLIIKAKEDLVLRYDLRGKVKPIPAPFADPEDKTGATALAKVPAQPGVFYPTGTFSLKLDDIKMTDAAIGDDTLEEGNRFMVVSMTAKNVYTGPETLYWDTFGPKLRDADGNEIEWNQKMVQRSSDKSVQSELEPGQELKFRLYFQVSKDVAPSTLTIGQGSDARQYVYDVSSAK